MPRERHTQTLLVWNILPPAEDSFFGNPELRELPALEEEVEHLGGCLGCSRSCSGEKPNGRAKKKLLTRTTPTLKAAEVTVVVAVVRAAVTLT